ncbi:Cytochrome c biogenesis ATP-binding export protein CcmA [Paraburkholderia ultramafica]|uniref:Cytochrome c biogenesis ATP-binding export protein CcmA n=1 Tax=Paraburkholderia ultramafica TaxID=1544867 RepID=A0A6S7BIA8_9BURK|nr:Cytochrome c biogenesis ATP-binding export protein CcmA [Paraburkholderia ultramafica]
MQSARAASNGAASRLTATGLACWRGSRLLFKELDFEVEAGQIVWVRGQNGRGKTSLLRLAAGLSAPEQGQILREGNFARRVPDDAPRCVFIGHANALKEDLTVSEALGFLLHIHGRPCELSAVHAALERLGLHSRRNAMVRTLSQGQRRRVALARLAIETDASLWILDEPFDALDADGVERVNGLMREHVQRGGGVLLSSHLEPSIPMLPVSEIDLGRYC